MAVKPPSPPVISGHPKKHSGQGNRPIKRIVIHSAVMPCEVGRARQLGEWNRDGVGGGSWHYSVDPEHTFQCSYDSYICWHAPPNSNSIGIEMADWPTKVGTAKTWRWRRENHKKMLARTARLTAHLCAAYDIPPKFIGWRGLRAGKKGITTHSHVSLAWRQSSHWDPGLWPRRKFMRMVNEHYMELMKDK
jgi:hypothetical protein